MAPRTSHWPDLRALALGWKGAEQGSGSVSVSELEKIVSLMNMEMTPTEVQALVAEADSDGSGEVDFEEVRSAALARLVGCAAARLAATDPSPPGLSGLTGPSGFTVTVAIVRCSLLRC